MAKVRDPLSSLLSVDPASAVVVSDEVSAAVSVAPDPPQPVNKDAVIMPVSNAASNLFFIVVLPPAFLYSFFSDHFCYPQLAKLSYRSVLRIADYRWQCHFIFSDF